MNRLEKFSGSLKAAAARFAAALGGKDRAKIILRIVLALVIIGLLRFLYEADKPWEDGIAAAEAAGEKIKTRHCVVTGLWWAAVFNVGVAAVLFVVSGWLTRPPGAAFRETARATPRIPWIPIVFAVLLASVITSIFTLPRLNHSLWFDEEYTMRRIVVGEFKRTDENGRSALIGEMTPRPASWSETLWFYEMPNNHPFFSICARLSHSLFKPELKPENPEAYYFSERALRYPAWLAGIGSLFTVALMLAWIGFPRAAIAAPLLLSIHPWFLRYASEARGYVFLFFFGPLLIYLLAQAISKGTWRWWIAYAVTQTLYIYSNASGINLLIMLNLAGCIMPFLRPETTRSDRWMLVSRLFLVSAISTMIFIQLIMPNVLGFSTRFRPHQNIELLINPALFRDILSSYATGMRWHHWGPGNPYSISTARLLQDHPIALPFFFSLLVLLATLGVVALWKRGAFARLLIPVFLLPAPLFVFEAYRKGQSIFYWYAIFILPFLWALVALGIDWLSGRCGRSETRHTIAAFTATAALGLFLAWLTTPQRSLLLSLPIEQSRESVESYRDVVNPYAPDFDDVISVGFWKYTRAYDPGHYDTKTFDDFKTVLALAEREKKPFYINYALPQLARRGYPEIMALADDPAIFRPANVFWGLEPAATRFVQEYIPGSFDFEAHTPSERMQE